MSDYLLVLGSSIILLAIFIAVFIWAIRKTTSDLQKLPEFTLAEVAAVRRQLQALLVGVPVAVLFLVLAPLMWEQPSPQIFLVGLILGFAPLVYIAMSSIRNRVTIGEGGKVARGARAIRSGVITLVFLILVFTGSAMYLFSLM